MRTTSSAARSTARSITSHASRCFAPREAAARIVTPGPGGSLAEIQGQRTFGDRPKVRSHRKQAASRSTACARQARSSRRSQRPHTALLRVVPFPASRAAFPALHPSTRGEVQCGAAAVGDRCPPALRHPPQPALKISQGSATMLHALPCMAAANGAVRFPRAGGAGAAGPRLRG
jgi:hypothetical protein